MSKRRRIIVLPPKITTNKKLQKNSKSKSKRKRKKEKEKEKERKIKKEQVDKVLVSLKTVEKNLEREQFQHFLIKNNASNQPLLESGYYQVECTVCNSIMSGKCSVMKRHLTTTKHRRCSMLFSEDVELRQTLPQELVKIFFQCGINIHAGSKLLQQSEFLRLIRTHQNFPSENTLRKHVEVLVHNEKRILKTQLANIKFSLIFDETTISNSRPVIGIIASNYQNSFCLRVGNLINGEAKTIYNIINETLEFYSIKYNQILALISDGARACISVGQMFQHKKIQHVVCGAHTLALITSLLIKIFEKVNLLITNVNTFFSTGKQSSRKRRWIEKYQKLIPKPSLIRWGTWFKTCISAEKNRLNLIEFVQKELASDNRNNLLLLLKDPECIEQLRLINYFGLIMNNLIINIQKKIISKETISDWMNLKSRLFEMYSTMGSVYLLRIKREVNLISENSLFLLKSFFNQVYQRYYPRWLLTERIIRKQMFFTPFFIKQKLNNYNDFIPEIVKEKIIPFELTFQWNNFKHLIYNTIDFDNQSAIEFWTQNQLKFPELSKYILNELSIHPTSCEVERLFSLVKLIDSERRNRLSLKALESEVMTKYNNH